MSNTGIAASGGGLPELREQVRGFAELPAYTSAAASEVDRFLSGTIAAGTDPSGRPWARRQRDGARAMRNARAAMTVRAVGDRVVVTLEGWEVFHHFGAQGKPTRTVIPKELDERLGDAIRRGAVKAFHAKTEAGKRGGAWAARQAAQAAGKRAT